jgi:hypothetical protein
MNYMYDPYWLMDACPQLFNIPKVFAIHGQGILAQWPTKPANWQLYKPSVPPYGTVHSKAMLLVYDGGIRVAIFTANFVETDNCYLRSGSCRTYPLAMFSNTYYEQYCVLPPLTPSLPGQ